MLSRAFYKKIGLARHHFDELKNIENSLNKCLPRNKDFDSNESNNLVNQFNYNLVPCVINIKSSIESFKLSVAIKFSDDKYLDTTNGWKNTTEKIKKDLGISITNLGDVDGKIRHLRNYLVHGGHPTFTFNHKKMKFVIPKYKRLNCFIIPIGNQGKIELLDFLENFVKSVEDFSAQLSKPEYQNYFLLNGASIDDDWLTKKD